MNKPYKVQLSNKTEVQIDGEELALIAEGIKKGSPIRVKRGIINPSFIVCVVGDTERWESLMGSIMGAHGSDEWKAEAEKRRVRGCVPLKDIFEDSPLQLNSGKRSQPEK